MTAIRTSGLLAGLAALLLLAVLALPAWGQTQGTDTQGQPAQTETQQGTTTQSQPAQGQAAPATGEAKAAGTQKSLEEKGYALSDIPLGNADAPLTVIEYFSFTCPHCAAFAEHTWPKVKEQYVDTGKVRWIMRDVYFDQYGLWASMVARCGGGQGYYEMVDTFLTTQSTWTRAPDIGNAIQQIGRRAGLSSDQLKQCLSDRDYAKALLETYQNNMKADDIKATPTFVINGVNHSGDMTFDAFSKLLDEALAKKS